MNNYHLTNNNESLCFYVVKFHKLLLPFAITGRGGELYFQSLKICKKSYRNSIQRILNVANKDN